MTPVLEKKRIALLGPPAAGKSALVQKLLRLLNPDTTHFNLDDDVIRLCAERQLTGSLVDDVIDEAVARFTRRYRGVDFGVVELPHHDYIALIQQAAFRLDDFDVILVITAPLQDLLARNLGRKAQVPDPYIARCFGAAAAIAEQLKQSPTPWLLLDSSLMSATDMAELVLSFLRRNISATLSKMEIAPVSQSPYFGGHFQSDVEWSHVLAERIVERFQVRNALDVGCGAGLTLDRFASLGVTCWGLEGNPRVLDGPCEAKERLLITDFHKQWVKMPTQFDLVWCVEVLEHIPPAFEENVVQTIRRNARQIVFISAGQPGQIGYFHVNCQPRTYWIERFERVGLRYLEDSPSLLRDLDGAGAFGKNFIKENGIFLEVVA